MSAESVMEPSQEIQAIVAKLSSRDKVESEEAERQLCRLGPDAVQDLLAILVRERHTHQKRKRILGGVVIAYFIIMIMVAILTHQYGLLGSLGSMTGLIIAIFATTQTQRGVATVLTKLEDLRTVGALAEALEFQDPNVARLAEDTLIRLLPQLQSSDAHLLDTAQRMCLYRALNRQNPALVRNILQALEQVGDAQAIPFVQKLADGKSVAAENDAIRTAAQHCLPYLLQHTAEERSRQTLLRASSVAEERTVDPDTLLRPASGVISTDPQQLLRANLPAPADQEQAEVAPEILPVTPQLAQNTYAGYPQEETALVQQGSGSSL